MESIDVVIGLVEPLMRQGVARVLEQADGLEVAAFASTADETLEVVEGVRPRVALVDTRFQHDDEAFLPRLSEAGPDTAIVVLVEHDEDECILRATAGDPSDWVLSDGAIARADECCLLALRHDALGCLPRAAGPERVVNAIRAAAEGRVAAEEWALARWVRSRAARERGDDSPARITGRELEVIRLVADGRSNKAVARELGLHEQTVKNHLARIMKKLGTSNRVEVALLAREHRLAP